MRRWHPIRALLLVCLSIALTACGSSKPAVEQPEGPEPSLELVRQYAAQALDAGLPSGERRQAREQAMSTLLAFLTRPESLAVERVEWEEPVGPRTTPLIRPYDAGAVQVYALTIPVSGVLPPGERVAVQMTGGSAPYKAVEVPVLPGGRLAAARASEENGRLQLTLAFHLGRGGGYVAHYTQDPGSDKFRVSGAVFNNLPSRMGDASLMVRDGYLMVTSPLDEGWQPRFDETHPLRLFVMQDLALEWDEGRFVIKDQRNVTAFDALRVALSDEADEKERQEAWDTATRKLPLYLQEMESWGQNLTARLPLGARVLEDEHEKTAVRLISIPAPPDQPESTLTVIQHRISNGLPSAQVISVPGPVEDFRVISRDGIPGLMILSDSGAVSGQPFEKTITLMKLTAGHSWAPAPDWFGSLPPDPDVRFAHAEESGHLTLSWTGAGSPVSIAMINRDSPSLRICKAAADCYMLTWMGGRFGGTGWVLGSLRKLAGPEPVTQAQVAEAVNAVKHFLLLPEARLLTAQQLEEALGRSQGLDIRVYDAGGGSRVVVLPPTNLGASPVLIQSGEQIRTETAAPGYLDQWSRVWTASSGEDRWLLLFGESEHGAALVLHRWQDGAWQPVDAVSEPVERVLGSKIRIRYQPGQTHPVRGLFVPGGPDLVVSFLSEGRGVTFCERYRACAIYQLKDGWELR